MKGYISISKKHYLQLQIAEEELNRLEGGGVDNWEGYVESLNSDGELNMYAFIEAEEARINALKEGDAI